MACGNAEVQHSHATAIKKSEGKRNWITDRCQEIDSGNSKAAFNTLKLLTQRQQTKKLIENMKGKLTEESDTHKRWTEYCMELYNYKLKTYANILKNEKKTYKAEKQEKHQYLKKMEKQRHQFSHQDVVAA